MASELAKRAWLVRTPAARVPPAETEPLAQRLIEEQPDAIAYVGPHGEYWYDCVVDSLVDFKITRDVDFPAVPSCWCATDEDARQILSMFVNDPSEIEVVEPWSTDAAHEPTMAK